MYWFILKLWGSLHYFALQSTKTCKAITTPYFKNCMSKSHDPNSINRPFYPSTWWNYNTVLTNISHQTIHLCYPLNEIFHPVPVLSRNTFWKNNWTNFRYKLKWVYCLRLRTYSLELNFEKSIIRLHLLLISSIFTKILKNLRSISMSSINCLNDNFFFFLV